jgi:hypothetical protein
MLLAIASVVAERVVGGAAVRVIAAAAAAASLVAVCALNRRAVAVLFALEGPARFRWLAPSALVLTAAALVAVVLARPQARRLSRVLAVLALAVCAAALLPARRVRAERPAPASAAKAAGDPLVVLGLDGADWRYIEPLIARGELPHLAALRNRGAWGALKTYEPTLSPIIWTSVATGKEPRDHGVRGFALRRLRGVADPLPKLRETYGLGAGVLLRWLERRGRIDDSPINSTVRRVPAFWNIATLHGSPVDVVDWWATWPAEPVLGHIVSERVYYRPLGADDGAEIRGGITYPEGLVHDLKGRVTRPEDLSLEQARAFMDVTAEDLAGMKAGRFPKKHILGEFPYFHAMLETDRKVALYLIEQSRARPGARPDLLLLIRLIDMTCHLALHFSDLVDDPLDASPEDVRRFHRVVSQSYRAVDAAVGEILAAFGNANVIVVSDHGFQRESHWPSWTPYYGHGDAPPGIFIGAGPAFRPGKVDGMTVYDVMPLMLYLKDFELAQDLYGTLRRDVLDAKLVAARPVRTIPTYGTREGGVWTEAPAGIESEMMERLRALGYVQ